MIDAVEGEIPEVLKASVELSAEASYDFGWGKGVTENVRASARPSRAADQALVRTVQRHLAALRHQPGPADGLLGPRTTAAVKAFQRNRGLPPTGQVTEELRALLEVKLQQR